MLVIPSPFFAGAVVVTVAVAVTPATGFIQGISEEWNGPLETRRARHNAADQRVLEITIPPGDSEMPPPATAELPTANRRGRRDEPPARLGV